MAQLSADDVDFTAVAGPFSVSAVGSIPDFLSIPSIVTGIVFFYNTNATLGNYSLIFDAALVEGIFSGTITSFSDNAFLSLNPQVASTLAEQTTPFTVSRVICQSACVLHLTPVSRTRKRSYERKG